MDIYMLQKIGISETLEGFDLFLENNLFENWNKNKIISEETNKEKDLTDNVTIFSKIAVSKIHRHESCM